MRHIFYGCISVLLAWIDLYVKKSVEKKMPLGKEQEACGGCIKIRHVHNRGFALNKVQDHPKVVKWVSIGALGSIAVYVLAIWKRSACVCEKFGAALILAGGISNTYERLKKGYVVDYFGFQTKWERFNRITFNLGDMFIFAGGLFLIVKEILKGNR